MLVIAGPYWTVYGVVCWRLAGQYSSTGVLLYSSVSSTCGIECSEAAVTCALSNVKRLHDPWLRLGRQAGRQAISSVMVDGERGHREEYCTPDTLDNLERRSLPRTGAGGAGKRERVPAAQRMKWSPRPICPPARLPACDGWRPSDFTRKDLFLPSLLHPFTFTFTSFTLLLLPSGHTRSNPPPPPPSSWEHPSTWPPSQNQTRVCPLHQRCRHTPNMILPPSDSEDNQPPPKRMALQVPIPFSQSKRTPKRKVLQNKK